MKNYAVTILKRNLLIFLAIALAACGSTITEDTWKEESYNKKISKILVIGIEKDEELRRLFEDTLVSQLKGRRVEATASLDLLAPDAEITRETVLPVVDLRILKI